MARLLMVLSSLSPLFLLWAIRGNRVIPDAYFISICLGFALLPTGFLWCRVRIARKENDTRSLPVGATEDHKGHVLVYLFAILLPLYGEEMTSVRDLMAMMVALALIVFLFWRLNLHYINVLFAIGRYQVFSVLPPTDDNRHTARERFVLITRRPYLEPGDLCVAYRLSNTVYLEKT